jgi:tyrosyl-tRNA synthetase
LAASVSDVLFGGWNIDEPTFEALATEVPTATLEAVVGRELVDVAVESGLCSSKSDARRLAGQNGLYVNNARPEADALVEADLRYGRYLLLRRGKADYRLVVVGSPSS